MMDARILEKLNAETAEMRLENLSALLAGTEFIDADARMVNNHIHTTYSFSPYSPTAAVFAARSEGLCTAGIVDHDSIGGAREFIEAGRRVGLPTTVGVETRVSMAGTPFERLRTNNPDQLGLSYMVLHGVPHAHIDEVQAYFAPLRARRNERNQGMLARVNALMGTALDFERDVLPLSQYHDGGTVTERHLMLALARRLEPGCDMPAEYDLVGRLKKDCIPRVYIDAVDECPQLDDYIAFAKRVDGILAYAYLGDVEHSVTGDKRAQRFEDAYFEELMAMLHARGVRAVTYMPTRNTDAQLIRLRGLCERYGMLQISGEDINSPRQSFVIEKLRDPQFENLIDSTWRIIRHENGV